MQRFLVWVFCFIAPLITAGAAGAAAKSEKAAKPKAAAAAKDAEAVQPPGAGAAKVADAKVAPVTKVDGGVTVGEVFKGRSNLSGKKVKIRGTVVKVTEGVMGKNWLHLQDGTGEAGSNDLVVTTEGQVEKGDKLLVEGTVATDKDFGYGYKYDVLVEDAKVTKE